MKDRWFGAGVLLAALLLMLLPRTAQAHGTDIGLTEVQAIEIAAHFDDGEPMSNAQVAIYAPDNPGKPWMTGEADGRGHFVFAPDRSIAGQWDVQVRSAGHGDWVYIDIAEGDVTALTSSSTGLTTAQIVMMSAAVIWGFMGTALYFARPKSTGPVPEKSAALVT